MEEFKLLSQDRTCIHHDMPTTYLMALELTDSALSKVFKSPRTSWGRLPILARGTLLTESFS
jgi:hypothetical protein